MTRHLAGREVFPVGYGAWSLSTKGRPPERKAIETVHAALEAGATLIDTADVYCRGEKELGHNERLIAEALATWNGARPLVATKGGATRPHGRWGRDASPAHLRTACEASLTALGVERIDLYQLHSPDPAVPIEDSVGELTRLRDEGKIAYLGVSNVDRAQLERACAVAAIASVQNRASPYAAGGLTDGVLDYCEANDIAFIAYSPVGGSDSGRTAGEAPLCHVGETIGATPFEVALAWLLAKSPVLIPIPGARQAQNARSSARAAAITLSSEQLESLDDAYGGGRR
ncbi:MAG: aldo/keto reductase [Deltaproteobacteria bacterium]|nr:aldo/keto reductase [Deltaproteobacteria bacterium]